MCVQKRNVPASDNPDSNVVRDSSSVYLFFFFADGRSMFFISDSSTPICIVVFLVLFCWFPVLDFIIIERDDLVLQVECKMSVSQMFR